MFFHPLPVWYSYNVPCQYVAVDRYSSRFAVIARLFNTSAKQLLVFTPDSSIPESCTPLTSSILGMEFEKDVLLVTDDYSILQLSATTPEVTSQEERAKISNEAPESGIFDSIFGRRQQEAREAAEQASKTEKIRQGEANVQEALALLAGPSQSLPGVSDIFESIMTSLMELRVVDNTVDGQVQAADVTMEESSENKEEIVDVTLDPNFKLDTFSDLKFPSLVDKGKEISGVVELFYQRMLTFCDVKQHQYPRPKLKSLVVPVRNQKRKKTLQTLLGNNIKYKKNKTTVSIILS